jgi:hypothetical protein
MEWGVVTTLTEEYEKAILKMTRADSLREAETRLIRTAYAEITFRQHLPRLYELRGSIEDPDSPNAYFQNLENALQTSPSALRAFTSREIDLQELDREAWEFLKAEAIPYLTRRHKERGWQQLFDILNQARAFKYLKGMGCSNIQFIPRSNAETPDIQGLLNGLSILCEVKTVNVSKEELLARNSGEARYIKNCLEQGFFGKLKSHIEKAKAQMRAYDHAGKARYCVYFNLCFDDFFGEYKEEYFQQIDQYFSQNPTAGIEVVVHNERSAFHKALTLTTAAVVNED